MSQASFQYRAIDAQGAATRGVLHARSQEEAYRQIVAGGMKPLRITAQHRRGGGRQKVTAKDLSQLTHQLSVLVEAQIPLVDGFRSLAEQETNGRLRAVIEDIATQVESGVQVTEALAPHRALFGDVYIETIRAAEASGNMTEILARLATMLEQQDAMRKDVRGALMYPACVIATLFGAVAFLMVFVIPRFAHMFSSRGVELPLPTQLVIGASTVVRAYWYVFIGVGVGSVWGLRRAWRSATMRQRIDGWLHHVPFLRDVLKGMAIGRFATVLGISLRSGLSLIEALSMAGRASGRPLLRAEADRLREQVNLGGRLSDTLISCRYLSPFTRRMLAAGEDAGEVPKMCQIISKSYDREVTHLAKNVTTVIEPILIVGLAGVVLTIALAIFLPMWNMGALVG